MSVLLYVACLAYSSTLAVSKPITADPPLQLPSSPPSNCTASSIISAPDSGQRSTWDIVWGCLVTIFACSWVSVHPNIPPPDARWWHIARTRLELMVWTILAPEVIILLAAKQWIAARGLRKTYRERGWTMTHGFFAQMGGFMLFDGKTRKGVLSPARLQFLSMRGAIFFPETTLEDIEDKSKGDGLSKGLVLVQTGWFMAQFAARVAQGLDVTQLELATLGFAALNGFMYFFWWHKPLDVRSAVPVYLVYPSFSKNEAIPTQHTPNAIDSHRRWDSWRTIVVKAWAARFRIVARIPDYQLLDTLNVPIFFFSQAFDRKKVVQGNTIAAVLGIVFGAIHCGGWNFHFPSVVEEHIWRIASFIIVAYPTMFLVISVPQILFPKFCNAPHGTTRRSQIIIESVCLWGIFLPIYILARLFILVEAFLALRNLPASATSTVQWTTVLPHV